MSRLFRKPGLWCVPQLVAVAMLAWALVPSNPYGYYVLLRFVVCGVCGYLMFRAIQTEQAAWAWVLGGTALLYNPFFRVHLTREIWSVVNVATIILLAITVATLRPAKCIPR